MNTSIGIHFGALCEDIKEQLTAQKFEFDLKIVTGFQRSADAILQLSFGDILTDSQKDKCYKRLHKKVVSHVAKVNKLTVKKP